MAMKKLIINADDFGLTEGVCRGIIEAGKRNAISSTSMMMCLPDKLAASEKYFPELTIPCGVHLQLTGEKEACEPLTPAMQQACGNGFFPSDQNSVNFLPEDVEAEWRAQIDLFIEHFGQPSHLDVHHGFQLRPEYQSVYLNIAKDYGLPVRSSTDLPDTFYKAAEKEGIVTAFCSHAWTGKFEPLETFCEELLAHFQTQNTVEIVMHCGFCDERLMQATSWNKVRQHEFDELTRPAFQTFLTENNINLVSWKNL